MGKPRKILETQKKHLTTNEKIRKEQEENFVSTGREQLARPPTWLVNSTAKKEFKRLVNEFNSINIIGNLDLNNIAGYCNAYAFYIQATKELKRQPLTLEKPLPNGSSAIVENPLVKIQKNYADEMRKFASLCGLTIDSRLKIAAIKLSEEEQDITSEFGDI